MNREIKFRAKCSSESCYKGEWVYGGYVPTERGLHLLINAHSDSCKTTYHVDPDTVGQFTGLKDKNGKEIYEGDIIRSVNGQKKVNGEWVDNEFIYTVEYSEGAFCGVLGLSKTLDAVEVIGNIYDNKELLKDER